MSLLAEVAQNFTGSRNPNLVDVVSNTVGSTLGALACPAVRARMLPWFHAAPFIAVIEPEKNRNSFDPCWSWTGFVRWSALWMVFGAAVRRAFQARWIPVLAAVSLLCRVFFSQQTILLDELAGLAFCWLPPGLFTIVLATAAMLLPATRAPRYLCWMETIVLAAGACWLAADRIRKGSPTI